MTPEQAGKKLEISRQGLEELINQKEPRLPNGLRRHIRDLKATGQLEKVMTVTDEGRERKYQTRQQRAENELKLSLRKIFETEDPQIQAIEEIRAIWLLHASGTITSAEKTEALLSTLDSKAPDLKAYLEGRLLDIRDELQPLLPTGKELNTQGHRRY